ncbi:hypothetical protein ACFE04_016619 [Oxalis oulophora]
MEIDTTSVPEVVSKKMLHLLRIIFYMLKTSKSKLMMDLNLMVKRGNKIAGKAIGNLLTFHHHRTSTFSCVSDADSLNFVSPREYEFSCSTTPVMKFVHHRRNRVHNYHHNVRHFAKSHYRYDDAAKTVAAVQKMLEMLNNEAAVTAGSVASPAVSLPGFGENSSVVRQLRITDSPFTGKDDQGSCDLMVDTKAEEFIKKFYKDLKLQKTRAAIESPEPYAWVR